MGSASMSSVVILSFAGAASLAGFSESTSTTRFVSKISSFDVGLEPGALKLRRLLFHWGIARARIADLLRSNALHLLEDRISRTEHDA